jgi:hypothetical protein
MTFAQRRNRLTLHFSERIPVVKQRIPVLSYVTCRCNSLALVGGPHTTTVCGISEPPRNDKRYWSKQNNVPVLWLCVVSCLHALWPTGIIRNPIIRIVLYLQWDIPVRNCHFSHVAPYVQSRSRPRVIRIRQRDTGALSSTRFVVPGIFGPTDKPDQQVIVVEPWLLAWLKFRLELNEIRRKFVSGLRSLGHHNGSVWRGQFFVPFREGCSCARRTEACPKSVYLAILPKLTGKLFEVLTAVVL